MTPPPPLSNRWAAVVEAERRFSEAVRDIPPSELPDTLVAALGDFSSRHVALAILTTAQPQLTASVLPGLEPLLLVSHSSLEVCRRLVRRLPEPERSDFLRRTTSGVTGDAGSDDEAYRRLAELLRSAGADELLSELARAASLSDDPGIREVGEDFGG